MISQEPKAYTVKRYIIEYYEVIAWDGEEALKQCEDPYRVEVIKTDVKEIKIKR